MRIVYGCQTCQNYGKVTPITVQPDGTRTRGPAQVCPECAGK